METIALTETTPTKHRETDMGGGGGEGENPHKHGGKPGKQGKSDTPGSGHPKPPHLTGLSRKRAPAMTPSTVVPRTPGIPDWVPDWVPPTVPVNTILTVVAAAAIAYTGYTLIRLIVSSLILVREALNVTPPLVRHPMEIPGSGEPPAKPPP